MPIHDFKCKECGKVSEFLLPGSPGDRILACTNCGSQNLEKLVSAPSLPKGRASASGSTCCGRTERCEKPPCSTGERCHKH